ncbi:MAG: hypothetical protein KME12_15345 [Trichocoleus desertorum ATA4-8-CV12]|jgi:hypothetical protein|nr:hypothetical protein [Trichocoleus desertorum ATA4-8-CV12]
MEQSDNTELSYNPNLSPELMRLHQVTVWGRWLVVVCLWLTVGLLSLWGLRGEIALWRQYFTWAAVRYGFAYNPIPTFGLALCIGLTVATLVWQSRNILFGLPALEKERLERQAYRIRQQGPSHPLWRWVHGDR